MEGLVRGAGGDAGSQIHPAVTRAARRTGPGWSDASNVSDRSAGDRTLENALESSFPTGRD